LTVAADPIAPAELGSVRGEWEALARDARASPYLAFGWLESWAAVYQPRGLILVRIADVEVGLVALALIEQRRFGALQFAGVPVTPLGGLLAGPEHEGEAWRAFGGWLRRHSRWSVLNGLTAGRCELPGATLTPVPWLAMELPGSFDEYLAARDASPRREFRRRLRVAEREGVTTSMLSDGRVREGLEVFASLHQARARAKGEVHRVIDDRLVEMLSRVSGHAQPELRVFVLEQGGSVIGVGVQIDHAGGTCAYNTGFDPAAARLGPGALVRLASIRDAIDRGGHWFDFGPGDFPYKRALGGQLVERSRIDTANGSVANGLLALRMRGERRLRRAAPLRRGVRKWREMRRAWYTHAGGR
jgi:CelD/BcsL family acetyltransferase involved in cellulose biosynthesis